MMQIDVERDRRQLGLPARGAIFPKPLRRFVGVLFVVTFASVLGLMAQKGREYAEEKIFDKALQEFWNTDDPVRVEELARRIRGMGMDSAETRFQTASCLNRAANILPDERLWQSEALNLAELAQIQFRENGAGVKSLPNTDFFCTLLITGLLLDLGQDKLALQKLADIDEKDLLVAAEREDGAECLEQYFNLKAYVLSSSSDPDVRDPDKAMEAIEKVIPGDWREGEYDEAYLDTLAECYYVNNQPEKAVEVQKVALAQARETDLAVFVEHYRKYAAAADKKKEKLQNKP
jgi:tetratricopeptide (TPR) repeat protein